MESNSSAILLKKLCNHICGRTKNEVRNFELAIQILNEVHVSEPFQDSSVICDKIKRGLVHEKRLQDAAKFSHLYSELQKSPVLRNKSGVLQLLLHLRNQANQKQENLQLPYEVENEPSSCYEFFKPSSLHINDERSTSGRSSSQNSSESVDKAESGRVAKLAAIYSADGKSKPVSREARKDSKRVPKSTSQPNLKFWDKREFAKQRDVSGDALIREVLFALQGIEGSFIKMDDSADTFRIDSKVRLSAGERQMLMKLVEIGWLYRCVKRFCDAFGLCVGGAPVGPSPLGLSRPVSGEVRPVNSAGLVNQSVVLALKEELNEYCRLIAVLEAQMSEPTPPPADEGGPSGGPGITSGGLTLRRLQLWTLEPRDRLRALASLTHSVKELKGGESVSALYQHVQHGSSERSVVVFRVLHQACRPLLVMLTEWLLDGTLLDPHQEFFVSADHGVSNEQLWHRKYSLRTNMVPSCMGAQLAQKALSAGKSLNFLRHACGARLPAEDRDVVKTALRNVTEKSLYDPTRLQELDELVGVSFRTASSAVLDHVINKARLVSHLWAVRRYLLLGQGDFIYSLMGLIGPELNKPADRLHGHALSYVLESAIGASNAQFDDPDILKRLDVRLLEASPGETGWDIFSLDYHVDGPIGTVFTPDCMCQYLMLFNSLWRAKRMETILASTWKQRSVTSKLCAAIPELSEALHRIQLLLCEMNHLLRQLAYYVAFEVLECSWHLLVGRIDRAQSLDDIIDAHAQFMQRIVAGALLDEGSRELLNQLRTLYDLMLHLDTLLDQLYNAALREITARDAFQIQAEERSKAGGFATSSQTEQKEAERRDEFLKTFVPAFQTDLKILSQSYQDMVQSFLLALSEHEDESLQLLSSRLDFNEHYARRDHRLSRRLTYLHRRKTITASFVTERSQHHPGYE